MRKSEDVKACNNLPNFIVQACDRYADKVAFHCGPSQLTYKEVEEKSRALACWFQHYTALQPGDRIAIQLPNILDFPIAAFAAMRAGLVLVNTNPFIRQEKCSTSFLIQAQRPLLFLPRLQTTLPLSSITQISTLWCMRVSEGMSPH